MAVSSNINIPNTPFLDARTGRPSVEWLQWLMQPSFIQLSLANALGPAAGGTGTTQTPTDGQLLIGSTLDKGYVVSELTSATGLEVVPGSGALQVNIANTGIAATSYGSGTDVASFTVNAQGQLTAAGNVLIAIDASQIVSGFLTASRLPAFSGDVSSPAGSTTLTLNTVNGSPGSYGSASNIATYTVNGKGLLTASGSVAVAIAAGQVVSGTFAAALITQASAMTVTSGFGCNGKGAQGAYASGGAVANNGATNSTPYGYTTAAQANAIVTLLNNIQAALVANGIMS